MKCDAVESMIRKSPGIIWKCGGKPSRCLCLRAWGLAKSMRNKHPHAINTNSRYVPPKVNQASFRALRRSSLAFIWLRVSFFFFDRGLAVPLFSSPDPAGVANLEAAGVLDALGRIDPGLDFPSANASSITPTLPICLRIPLSTFQISGQSALTNSWWVIVSRDWQVASLYSPRCEK